MKNSFVFLPVFCYYFVFPSLCPHYIGGFPNCTFINTYESIKKDYSEIHFWHFQQNHGIMNYHLTRCFVTFSQEDQHIAQKAGGTFIKITQLEYFCATCRHHSITQAARELYVTQPAISSAIRELEKEFSINLFIRSKNHVTLTKEGELFYQKAQDMLRYIKESSLELHDLGRQTPRSALESRRF